MHMHWTGEEVPRSLTDSSLAQAWIQYKGLKAAVGIFSKRKKGGCWKCVSDIGE
jgi:hypothetical protein